MIVSMYAVCYMFFLTLLPRDYAHYAKVSFSKYLFYIICCTLCCYFPDRLDKKSLNEHYTLTEKCRCKMIDPVCTTYYSDMAHVGRPSIDPVFILHPHTQIEIKLLILIVIILISVQSCRYKTKLR